MYQKTVLDNGMRIITEELPHCQSVALGIWINTGSRDEVIEQNGVSHFIEHLLFKGTKRRSASRIAKEIDSVGGILNAFTGREYTGVYSKILSRHLSLALDVVSDIFLNSLFDPKDIEKERKVIMQEINLAEDTPDDYVHDLFNLAFWGNHPLGKTILGTTSTVASFTRDMMVNYFRTFYVPPRVVVSAAGKLRHRQVVELVKRSFDSFDGSQVERNHNPVSFSPKVIVKPKELEQIHFCLGTVSLSHCHPERYSSFVLNAIFGGNMSSRLFQQIREERGLAYAVYSYLNSYQDTGSLTAYVGTSRKSLRKVVKLILDEFQRLTEQLVGRDELRRAKEQLKGNLLLSAETTEHWMSRLAKNELYFGRNIPLKETLSGIDSVTGTQVRSLGREIFQPKYFTLAVLGSLTEGEIPRAVLPKGFRVVALQEVEGTGNLSHFAPQGRKTNL